MGEETGKKGPKKQLSYEMLMFIFFRETIVSLVDCLKNILRVLKREKETDLELGVVRSYIERTPTCARWLL